MSLKDDQTDIRSLSLYHIATIQLEQQQQQKNWLAGFVWMNEPHVYVHIIGDNNSSIKV